MTPIRVTPHLSAHTMVAQQTHIQVKCLHECHMSCMKCHHAHIPSHSPTPSHMPMPSVTTVTGSTNDTHIPSPYRLTSTQCKCQWATNPESIPTPITQPEVYVINMTVCLLWVIELFESHHGSLTPMLQNFLDHMRVSYTHVPGFSPEGVNSPLLAPPNTHYLYLFLCFKSRDIYWT